MESEGIFWVLWRSRQFQWVVYLAIKLFYIFPFTLKVSTYDHRVWKTGLPVRSAVLKPHAGRLVVGWVTTSESRLLYVFFVFLFFLSVFFFFFCFGERSEHPYIELLSVHIYKCLVLRMKRAWMQR